jgi:hypothetical protein
MATATQPDPAPPDPMDDPILRQRVELGKDFAFHLLKAIKQIGMYRHAEAKFPEFLEKAHQAITAYTTDHGALSLKVEQKNLALYGQSLFAEDTALPYKFFRDGIRQLIFRPELTIEELVAFTMIALSDVERGAEDVLAQLWKAAMEHIEYIVVEGFKMDDSSEEEVQVEVDKIVNYLHGRLRSNSDDFLRFARVSTDDLDNRLEGVEQIRGAVIVGATADDTLKAKVQKEIEEEEGQRLFPKLVGAVFQVVEGGVDDAALLEEMFIQLLDAMLLQEDFATINQVVLKLRAMEQKAGENSSIQRLREAFVSKMGEEQRLTRVGEILRSSKPKSPSDIVRYINSLDGIMVPTLLSVLETIEIPENRVLLCDVLASFAKEIPDPFVNRIGSERPQTVRDMVYILEKTGHPDRFKMFGQVLRSKNLALKLDILQIIARGKTGECRKLIAEALNDVHPQVRIVAARVLPELDREKAYVDLMRVVKDPSFGKKSADERAALYSAVGATGLPGAISMMTQLLQAKPTLFNKQRVLEDKLLAVQGLQGACTIATFKLLQEITEDKGQPPEVVSAARKAMYITKKALFGDQPASGG